MTLSSYSSVSVFGSSRRTSDSQLKAKHVQLR